MSTEFSADEVGLQFTWAWGLSPLSAKCLPASPQVVRNLFSYGKGHHFVAWLRDIILLLDSETFVFVPFIDYRASECQTLWGYGDSTCLSLSLYRSKCDSKILTANEDPPVRSPRSIRLKWVLEILIVNPWIPLGATLWWWQARGTVFQESALLTNWVILSHSGVWVPESRRDINK